MGSDEDLRFLGAIPYFRGLSPDELSDIRAWCHVRELAGGEILLLEGAPADALFVVRHGSVRIFKTSPLGKEQVLIILGPGETFNDVPVFDGGPNPAGAQAGEAGEAYACCRRRGCFNSWPPTPRLPAISSACSQAGSATSHYWSRICRSVLFSNGSPSCSWRKRRGRAAL
ncbi:MAG TPA: cyclic nucleotide-binding domain-containing protein [Chloroflexota bacterium]